MSSRNAAEGENVQEQAYIALSQVFTKYQPQERGQTTPHPKLTIEVLPKGIDPPEGQFILEDEDELSVGIPKKVLVAAFLHARRKFMEAKISEREDEEIRIATMIILLFDPEFLTAANARKQYLLNIVSMKAAYGPMHHMLLSFAIRSELWFLDSILTSPLHRQSKSPTLWYQRAWLYRTFAEHCDFMLATKDDLLTELDIVLKAAGQHQHNYYAFQYARRMLKATIEAPHAQERYDIDANASSTRRLISEMLHSWCKAHPSDTSGWSFLLYWISSDSTELAKQVVRSTLHFALSVRWKGEALWAFLRTITGLHQEDTRTDLDNLVFEVRDALAELYPALVRSSVPS